MKHICALLLALAVVISAAAQTTWTVDKNHSKVGFNVNHMGISEVDGTFNDFTGTVVTTKDDFDNAKVTFSGKTASVDTDNEKRDNHLRSSDFFDAEKYPEIKFIGTLNKGQKEKTYTLKGNLTMKGVTKPVEFTVNHGGSVNTGQVDKAGFRFTGEINRHDYGLTWSKKVPTGELVVGDIVTLDVRVEVDKKEATASK